MVQIGKAGSIQFEQIETNGKVVFFNSMRGGRELTMYQGRVSDNEVILLTTFILDGPDGPFRTLYVSACDPDGAILRTPTPEELSAACGRWPEIPFQGMGPANRDSRVIELREIFASARPKPIDLKQTSVPVYHVMMAVAHGIAEIRQYVAKIGSEHVLEVLASRGHCEEGILWLVSSTVISIKTENEVRKPNEEEVAAVRDLFPSASFKELPDDEDCYRVFLEVPR